MVRTRGRGNRGTVYRNTGGRGIGDRGQLNSIGTQQQSNAPVLETHESEDIAGASSTRPGISSTCPSTSCSRPADIASEDRDTDILHDRRKEIYVERPLMRRFRPTGITHDIMKEVMDRLPGFAPTWKDYPRDVKDALYAAFKATYKFALPEDESLGQIVWDRTCQDRYPESIRNLRIAGLKKNNTTDIAQTKGNPPRGIKVEDWNRYVDYWLSEAFQRRSEAAKANRRALPDAAVHSGGSISFAVTREKMEKEMGGSVSMRDVYERTHKRKGTDDFVSEHAREFLEKLDAGLAREYGDNPNEYPEFDPNIWLEAAGSSKKRRVEGLGGSLSFSTGSCDTVASPSFLQSSQAKQSEIHEMKEQISTIQKDMQNMHHGQQAMQETMQQLLASLTPLLSSMVASRSNVGASSQQQDTHNDSPGSI